MAPTQDLRKRNDAAVDEPKMAVVEGEEEGREEEEEEEEEEADKGGKEQRKTFSRRAAAKYDQHESFQHFLNVITHHYKMEMDTIANSVLVWWTVVVFLLY